MKEKYSCYEFEIRKIEVGEWKDRFEYRIFGAGCYPYDDGVVESDEWYDTEIEARNAATSKIDDLENP